MTRGRNWCSVKHQSAAASDKSSYLGDIKRRGEPTVEDLKNRLTIYGKEPNNRGVVIEKILNHEISMKLSNQEFLKHVEGTKKFEEYADTRNKKGKGFQSRLTVAKDDAQKIIYQYAGTGTLSTTHNGVVEYITLGKSVGDYYSLSGEWIPTKRVMIIYKEKSAHIVPVKEIDKW